MTDILPNIPAELTRPSKAITARVPFLINTYISRDDATPFLAGAQFPDNAVFVGVSGLNALSMAAAGNFKNAVLVNTNQNELKAIHNILKLVEDCQTPQEAIDVLSPHIAAWATIGPSEKKPGVRIAARRQEDFNYFNVLGIDHFPTSADQVKVFLEQMAADGNSWLSADNLVKIVRMQKEGRIQTAIVDITDPANVKKLDDHLRTNGFETGAFYGSSIRNVVYTKAKYFDGKGGTREDYDAGVKILLAGPASPGYSSGKIYIQTATQGMDVLSDQPTGPSHALVKMPHAETNYTEAQAAADSRTNSEIDVPSKYFRAGNYVLYAQAYEAIPDRVAAHTIMFSLMSSVVENRRRQDVSIKDEDLQKFRYRVNQLLDKEFRGGGFSIEHAKETEGNEAIAVKINPNAVFKKGGKITPAKFEEVMHKVIETVERAWGQGLQK